MDIQEYILSGVIEAYVTGIADEREIREVEAMAESHPEIKAAVEECRKALEGYAGIHAVMPPPEMKHAIWQTLQQDLPATATSATPPVIPQATPAQSIHSVTAAPWKYGMAAAILLLAGSLAGNIYLVKNRDAATAEMAALQQQQEALVRTNAIAAAQQQASTEALQLMMDTMVKHVPLNGVGTHTDNKAMVYWDSRSGAVFLSLTNMPEAPEGKQYQLWAIVNGQPVDAGMYNSDGSILLHRMKTIPKAEMFAITLEKQGGNPTPTMDQMMVAGKPG